MPARYTKPPLRNEDLGFLSQLHSLTVPRWWKPLAHTHGALGRGPGSHASLDSWSSVSEGSLVGEGTPGLEMAWAPRRGRGLPTSFLCPRTQNF